MNRAVFGLMLLILFSCNSPKDELINSFNTMYSDLCQTKFDEIENYLDDESKELFDILTKTENYNIDSLAQIGENYRIKYFCLQYYLRFGLDDENVSKEDFFKFLIVEQISFFDFKELRIPIYEKSRIGIENFVAVYHNFFGSKKLDWVKFSEDKSGRYKYNLIYTLQINEKNYSNLIGNAIDNMNKESAIESYKELYKLMSINERTNINDEFLWQKISELK